MLRHIEELDLLKDFAESLKVAHGATVPSELMEIMSKGDWEGLKDYCVHQRIALTRHLYMLSRLADMRGVAASNGRIGDV
jgi:hypothetical protein